MVNKFHKENLISQFASTVIEEMSQQELTSDQAFVRVVAKALGHNLDDENFVDGAGDRGIDFWYSTNSGYDLYQVKSHDLTETDNINSNKFDKNGVLDLMRIRNYLMDSEGIPEHNSKLKRFKERWNHTISSKRLAVDEETNTPVIVNLVLVLVGESLTDQAMDEYLAFVRDCSKLQLIFDSVKVEFKVSLITINEIIETLWREENREWRNIKGQKQNSIELYPEYNQYIVNSQSAVFYCRAIDLVNSYKDFGYQLFEPNVRCNIKKSKVNSAIRDSIEHRASRRDFRYLNNGVTITCKSFSKPSANRSSFKVIEPGIVNGLQTVVSITEAYDKLTNDEKEDFHMNCYVIVRILQENVVKNIDDVVKATNTQNKMESRNLLSNNPEQILYEKLFADLGWFYERKQDAWQAFANDSKRWRTLPNKKKMHFLVNPQDNRSKARTVDNEEIAQSWLSFIGFSEIAVHEKASLFENLDRYNYIFLHRPKLHGYDYKFQFSEIVNNSIQSAPNPELLLISYLVRNFARNVILSPKENYEQSCKRMNIDPLKLSREEVVATLSKDSQYLLGLALSGMSYTFVEFFGYALYKAVGDKVHEVGKRLLSNHTLKALAKDLNFKEIKISVANEDFEENDILPVMWHAFRYVVNEMMSSFWAETFRAHTNRSRFIAHKDTRAKILNGLEETNRYTTKIQLTRVWARGIKVNRGLFGYLQDVLLED